MTYGDSERQPVRMHPKDQWQSLVGEIVEIRLNGKLYRQGVVEDAMPDASGLWVAQEGAAQREFIEAAYGFEVLDHSRLTLERAAALVTEVAQVREQLAPTAGRCRRGQRHLDEVQMQSIIGGHGDDRAERLSR